MGTAQTYFFGPFGSEWGLDWAWLGPPTACNAFCISFYSGPASAAAFIAFFFFLFAHLSPFPSHEHIHTLYERLILVSH